MAALPISWGERFTRYDSRDTRYELSCRSGGLRLSSDKQMGILAYQLTKVNKKTAKIVKIFGRPELAEWVYWSFLFILSTVEWVYQRKPFFAKKTLFMP
jgi:hypothetical protein